MERRTLLAMALCLLVFVGWQKYYLEPQLAAQRAAQSQTAAQTSQPSAASSGPGWGSSGSSAPAPKAAPLISKPLQTRIGTAQVSNGGHFFSDWTLKSYKLDIAASAAAVDMDSVTHEPSEVKISFEKEEYNYLQDVTGQLAEIPGGLRWTYEDAKVKLTREFLADETSPIVRMKVGAEFKTPNPPKYLFVTLDAKSPLALPTMPDPSNPANTVKSDDPQLRDRQLIYWSGDSLERNPLKESLSEKDAVKESTLPAKWVSATNRYFILSVIDDSGLSPMALFQQTLAPNRTQVPYTASISLAYALSGNSISVPMKAFFGPKELDVLREVEPTLDHTVDFGWFTVFAYPLLRIMKTFYEWVKNWGFSIILLTLLVKVVTFPLTYKSMKSMKEMAKLQPQLNKIREKYKDDKEALNREMMNLMRTHGYNPAAGCLPMLVQMPVFFALYRVLYSSIELYHAPFGLWIHDLAAKDPFYVTPLLLTMTMFFQQKLTPNTAADPAQQKMMQFMPLMFGFMMISLPSGLTLYMLVNAIAGIFQQLFLNRKLGTARGTTALAAR